MQDSNNGVIRDSVWRHNTKRTQYIVLGRIVSLRYDEEDGWVDVDFVCYKELGGSSNKCYAQPIDIFLRKMTYEM